jgi:hypothetical protein
MTIKNGLTWGKLEKHINALNKKALAAVGLQLINNVNEGSMRVGARPPILEGTLRSSGSVFVGSSLIHTTNNDGKGRPVISYSDKKNRVTVIYNTAYAARWHENRFTPGPISSQDGNVEYKYLEKHLKGDGDELMALYAAKMHL